ncbi:hypothetical protein BH11PAT4_BH11PAT4_5350 [soil metagenome]
MKNYVYIFNVEQSTKDTEEDNAAWGAWYESLGDAVVDGGNPFAPDTEAQIKEGVVTMERTSASGYTIVKATDLKAAVTMAMTCPLANAPHCSVNVYETSPM